MSLPPNEFYVFGPFRLDRARRVLHHDGAIVPLPAKALDLLLVLVENRGRVLTKEELLASVWPNAFVEEGNLPVNVFALRKALGDDGERFIKTVPKRGYAFVAEARLEAEEPAGLSAESGVGVEAPPPVAVGAPVAQRPRWKRLLAAAAFLLAAVLGAWSYVGTTRMGRAVVPGRVQSLAILPFSPAGADAEHDALRAGVTAELIERLAVVPGVATRPMASTWKFSGSEADVADVGRSLQADLVLTGNAAFVGDTARVAARLVRVADGTDVWQAQWAEPMADLPSLVSDLALHVARAAAPSLTQVEEAHLRQASTRLASYEPYLVARGLAHQMTAREVTASVEYFEAAVAADAGFAPAHAGLASFLALPLNPALGIDQLERARAEAARAIALDPSGAEGHLALGRVLNLADWNWPGAAAEYQRAIALTPNVPEPHLWYGVHLSAQGRHDAALAEMRLAQGLDPTSPRTNYNLGMTLLMARRYEDAVAQFRQTPLEMGPSTQQVYLGLALTLAKQERYDQALSIVERIQARSGGTPSSRAHQAWILAQAGRRDEAQPVLRQLETDASDPRLPGVVVAAAYACAGDHDRALAAIDRAIERRDVRSAYLKVDPTLDCLRTDPRFASRVQQIGLKP